MTPTVTFITGSNQKETQVIGIIIAVVIAALVYLLAVALGLPSIVCIIAAILVLFAGVPTGGFGLGNRGR